MFPSKKELRKKKYNLQRKRRNKNGDQRKLQNQIRATEIVLPPKYIPPLSWKEAAHDDIPIDPCERTSYLANVNGLCEYALRMMRGVPIEEAGKVWRKILLYRFKHREKILEEEKYGRESLWQSYMTLCRVKFVTHGASWANSSKRGSEFSSLRSLGNTTIIIDTTTPIRQYTLRTLRLAIFQLQKEWKQLIYSEDLVSYTDHLERLVCIFLSGTFPGTILNYGSWCTKSANNNSTSNNVNKNHMQTNSEFITMMEIIFHEIRYDIYHYHKMLKQMHDPLQEYRITNKGVRQRLNEWIKNIASNVYADVVLKEFRDRFIESQIRIAEREYYSYKNDEEGISHNPQSVISYFRADELGVYEEISDYKISKTLEIAGSERDIMIFSVLEFYYSSLHSGEKEENRSFHQRYFTLQASEELSLEYRDSPTILRLFHRISVYDPTTRKLTMCGDLATAVCYWLKISFANSDSNMTKTMENREPKLKDIYDYIHKSIDSERKRELEFNSIYRNTTSPSTSNSNSNSNPNSKHNISEWVPSSSSQH